MAALSGGTTSLHQEEGESVVTIAYLENTAKQAGLETCFITMTEISLDIGRLSHFTRAFPSAIRRPPSCFPSAGRTRPERGNSGVLAPAHCSKADRGREGPARNDGDLTVGLSGGVESPSPSACGAFGRGRERPSPSAGARSQGMTTHSSRFPGGRCGSSYFELGHALL
jgi:hypothetical protein